MPLRLPWGARLSASDITSSKALTAWPKKPSISRIGNGCSFVSARRPARSVVMSMLADDRTKIAQPVLHQDPDVLGKFPQHVVSSPRPAIRPVGHDIVIRHGVKPVKVCLRHRQDRTEAMKGVKTPLRFRPPMSSKSLIWRTIRPSGGRPIPADPRALGGIQW